MINFSSLPTENPFSLPKPDVYMAKIVEATMKAKNGGGEYLNLKYQLTDGQGVSQGTVYDIISESDSSVIQYKIGRFIRACGLPLTGAMELKDIGKLVVNRTIAVDINIAKDKDGKYPDKAQVDLFSREAYYTADEFAEIYALVHPDENAPKGFMNEPTDAGEVPFNAPDGGAAATPNTTANY